ncbi:O-antigen ligase family protein [Halomonas sp. M4R5S39]|uniref:O-antigen ligase family protein n=1 Tax=Halomonas kalidii TaxID=3043293 RepID=UPI0024A9B19A|nr:O-antigen ligase family protein [Halomonas kalidii]MDI5985652.1 O-antigen ligase family protein [Halomonas kalidii]
MTLFDRGRAAHFNGIVLFLVLALLVSTPVRVHVLIALLALYAIAYLVVARESVKLSALDYCVMAILSLYAISHIPVFWLSGFSWRYLSPGLHMVAVIPIYLMLRHASPAISLTRYRDYMEWGAVIGALGAATIAIYQTQWQGGYKADGFLFHINFGYLSCSLLLVCVALMHGSSRKIILALGVLAGLAATLLSISRGAIFVIPLVLAMLLVLNFSRIGALRVTGAVIGFIVLAIISYATVPMVKERMDFTVEEFSSIAEGNVEAAISSGGRLQLWRAATEAFKERPSIGLTYDEREAFNHELVDNGVVTEWVLGVSRGHAHSQYFETLASGGVIGLFALIGYLIIPGAYFLSRYVKDPENTYALVGVTFSAAFALFCLTEVALQHEMIATYYAYMQVVIFVLALVYGRQGNYS